MWRAGDNARWSIQEGRPIAQACGRKAVRIDRPMQPGDVRDTFADISALAADTGYAPHTSIDEGIPRFVDWYRRYVG